MINHRRKATTLAVSALVLAGLLAPTGSSASATPAGQPLSTSELRGLS